MSDELTPDQVAYCREKADERRKMWAAHRDANHLTRCEQCGGWGEYYETKPFNLVACPKCAVPDRTSRGLKMQYDAHVQEYYFRRRVGLMVLQPFPPAVVVGNA